MRTPGPAFYLRLFQLGIFSKRTTREGAILGMVSGITFTAAYIVYFNFVAPELNTAEHWWLGSAPRASARVGMLLNFAVTMACHASRRPRPPTSRCSWIRSGFRGGRARRTRSRHSEGDRPAGRVAREPPARVQGRIALPDHRRRGTRHPRL